jgi:hypothetical protein
MRHDNEDPNPSLLNNVSYHPEFFIAPLTTLTHSLEFDITTHDLIEAYHVFCSRIRVAAHDLKSRNRGLDTLALLPQSPRLLFRALSRDIRFVAPDLTLDHETQRDFSALGNAAAQLLSDLLFFPIFRQSITGSNVEIDCSS